MQRPIARLTSLLLVLTFAAPAIAAEIITTIAGGGDHDLPALEASIGGYQSVHGEVIAHPDGSVLVLADHLYRITPNGRQFIVAGNGVRGDSLDGLPAKEAMLRATGLAIDSAGTIYIADGANNKVRRIDGVTGILSTIAGTGQPGHSGDGGPATSATMGFPIDTAVDQNRNVYVTADNRVRRIAPDTGFITTVAGTGAFGYTGDGGPAINATFNVPTDLECDAAGNLFILDFRVVRRVDRATGIITTVAGNGTQQQPQDGVPATSVGLYSPHDIGLDSQGGLLIADANRVRRVDLGTGIITTIAGGGSGSSNGDGGPATLARLSFPSGVAADSSGNLYIADVELVRRVDATTGIIDSIAGRGGIHLNPDGIPAGRLRLLPQAVAITLTGDLLFAESSPDGTEFIRRVDASTGRVRTIAGGGTDESENVPALAARLRLVTDLEIDPAGTIHFLETGDYIEPGPNNPGHYVGSHRVRRIDPVTGTVRTVAGTGYGGIGRDGVPANTSALAIPVDMSFDSAGNLLIAEYANFDNGPEGGMRVRKVSASAGLISTVAGIGWPYPPGEEGGPATEAGMLPRAVAADPVSGDFYIADSSRVRRVSAATGGITTVFDRWAESLVMNEAGILFIGQHDFDYQAQVWRGRVDALDVDTGTIQSIAGNGLPGLSGDGGPALEARLGRVDRLALDLEGRLVMMDTAGSRVRQVGLGGLANRPPVADAGDTVARGCVNGVIGIPLDGSASTDPDGDLASYEWYEHFGQTNETLLGTGPEIEPALAEGSHDVTLRVEDRRGLSDLDAIAIEISGEDLRPPTLAVSLDPSILWPPGHQLIDVEASIAAGDDCGTPAVVLESIVSSESDDAPGLNDGATTGDIQGAELGTDDRSFALRAERNGQGAGRNYTVTYRARDGAGRSAAATAGIFVPHDVSGRTDPVDLTLEETSAGTRLRWQPVEGAIVYDAVRGSLPGVKASSHEIRLGTLRCIESASLDTATVGHEDPQRPVPGEAFFYLVQYDDGRPSGFGAPEAPLPRSGTGGCDR